MRPQASPDELVSAYADGQTTPAQSAFVEALIRGDPHYRALLQRYRETSSLLRRLDDERWTPPDLRLRIALAQGRVVGRVRWVPTARSGFGAALVILATLGLASHGRSGMERAATTSGRLPTVAVRQAGSPCAVCQVAPGIRYVRLYGRRIPTSLVHEVAGELAMAQATTGSDSTATGGHSAPGHWEWKGEGNGHSVGLRGHGPVAL